MKKILIINGPNLNLLGKREIEIYGKESLKDIEINTKKFAEKNNLELSFKQSNEESEIINWIQDCMKNSYNGLLINAGAYTHTSIAIFDALKAIKIPKESKIPISRARGNEWESRHRKLSRRTSPIRAQPLNPAVRRDRTVRNRWLI